MWITVTISWGAGSFQWREASKTWRAQWFPSTVPTDHLTLPHMWLFREGGCHEPSQGSGGNPEVTGWGRIWALERMPPLHHTVSLLKIYFPPIVTGYKSLGGKDCHIQLVYLSSDWKYRRGTLCSASLKTKMTKMPGELRDRGEWYPQICKRILLVPLTAYIKSNLRWLRCPC